MVGRVALMNGENESAHRGDGKLPCPETPAWALFRLCGLTLFTRTSMYVLTQTVDWRTSCTHLRRAAHCCFQPNSYLLSRYLLPVLTHQFTRRMRPRRRLTIT